MCRCPGRRAAETALVGDLVIVGVSLDGDRLPALLSHRLDPSSASASPVSIPHEAAASTARCHASAGVAPLTLMWFSPLVPSTCQTVRLDEAVNAILLGACARGGTSSRQRMADRSRRTSDSSPRSLPLLRWRIIGAPWTPRNDPAFTSFAQPLNENARG